MFRCDVVTCPVECERAGLKCWGWLDKQSPGPAGGVRAVTKSVKTTCKGEPVVRVPPPDLEEFLHFAFMQQPPLVHRGAF